MNDEVTGGQVSESGLYGIDNQLEAVLEWLESNGSLESLGQEDALTWFQGILPAAATGAATGAAAGPWGALIGAGVGAGLGALQTAQQQKQKPTTTPTAPSTQPTAPAPTTPPTAGTPSGISPQLLQQLAQLLPLLMQLVAQLSRQKKAGEAIDEEEEFENSGEYVPNKAFLTDEEASHSDDRSIEGPIPEAVPSQESEEIPEARVQEGLMPEERLFEWIAEAPDFIEYSPQWSTEAYVEEEPLFAEKT